MLGQKKNTGMRSYSFALRNMSFQDEMTFKSMVRVLPDDSPYRWRYEPDLSADVLIVGFDEGTELLDISPAALDRFITVRLGAAVKGIGQLPQSFQIGDVLLELNRAGIRLAHRSVAASLAAIAPVAATTTVPAPAITVQPLAPVADVPAFVPPGSDAAEATLGLLGWPKSRTLNTDPRFVRIATVLAAKPCTLMQLSARSGQPYDVCVHLVSILHSHLLIRDFGQVANGVTTKIGAQYRDGGSYVGGVFVRAAASTPTRAAGERPAEPWARAVIEPPPQSLWGRIRRSLGLSSGNDDRGGRGR